MAACDLLSPQLSQLILLIVSNTAVLLSGLAAPLSPVRVHPRSAGFFAAAFDLPLPQLPQLIPLIVPGAAFLLPGFAVSFFFVQIHPGKALLSLLSPAFSWQGVLAKS